MVELSQSEIIQSLQQMDPYEFETLVADVWELQGYKVTVRRGSGDRGIDVEATKEIPYNQKELIQAKCYSEGNKVGSEEVRKYATLYDQVPDTDTVVIVTTSRFTTEAEKLAEDLSIKCVDINIMSDMISGGELIERHLVSGGPPESVSEEDDWSKDFEWVRVSDEIKSELRSDDVSTSIYTRNKDRDEILKVLKSALEAAYEDSSETTTLQASWELNNTEESITANNASFLLRYVENGQNNIESRISFMWDNGEWMDCNELKATRLETEFDCEIRKGSPSEAVRQIDDGKYEHDLNMILHMIEGFFDQSVADITTVMYSYC